MAFPTTSVLEAFTGTGALSASWTNPVFTGDETATRASGQLAPPGSGFSYAGHYWNASTFGADSEVYLTVVTKGSSANSGGMELLLRLTGLDGSPSGYSLFGNHGQSGSFTINRYDNGTFTQLGAAITQAVSDGDTYGFEAIGSTLKAYRKPSAGTWGQIGTSRTDTTYSAAGNLGFEFQDSASGATNHRGDDFGGGTVVGGGTPQALAAVIAGQSTVAGSLSVRKPLTAVVAGQSSVAGALSDGKPLAATVAGQSAVAAALTDSKALAAAVAGQSAVTAGLSDGKPLAATIAGQSDVAAQLAGAVTLAATIAGQSGVTAALLVAKALQAAINGGSSVAAALKVYHTLAAQIDGLSGVSAALTDQKDLAAALTGQSRVLASLTTSAGSTVVVASPDGQNAVIHIVTNQ